MYLGLRIAELKTQLQLNELARDGTRGEGRTDGPQKKGAKEERSWARVWRRVEEVGQETR